MRGIRRNAAGEYLIIAGTPKTVEHEVRAVRVGRQPEDEPVLLEHADPG